MRKVLFLATAALFVTTATFADNGGKRKKKGAKAKTCDMGKKSCCKDKAEKTVSL